MHRDVVSLVSQKAKKHLKFSKSWTWLWIGYLSTADDFFFSFVAIMECP